jgi:thiamine-monophosphate kinase
MDVSDGLVGDLRAMMRASGASARIDLRRAPLSEAAAAALRAEPALLERLVCGGDDYEILCAVPPGSVARFEALAAAAGEPVAPLGTVGPALTGDIFIGPDGQPVLFREERFSHF